MKTKELDKLIRRLWIEYIAVWILALGIPLIYETGMLEEGDLAHDGQMCYIVQTLTVILALCLIPVSLKMYHQAVHSERMMPPKEMQDSVSSNEPTVTLSTKQLNRYRHWNEVRLALLAVVALVGMSVYYVTLSSIGGLCALMGLVATFFCLPTRQRIKEELRLSL